jgi:CubicO group peptidase (beta-lactamase class C family)
MVDRPETSKRVGKSQINFDAGGGGGGILSSIGDYARFSQMLLNGGELEGSRIIGRKTVQLMTSNHCGVMYDKGLGPGFCWGLGVVVFTGPGIVPIYRSVGTYSNTGAAGTFCFIDPKEDLLCLCFTQVLNHRVIPGCNYQEDFERLVYQALL